MSLAVALRWSWRFLTRIPICSFLLSKFLEPINNLYLTTCAKRKLFTPLFRTDPWIYRDEVPTSANLCECCNLHVFTTWTETFFEPIQNEGYCWLVSFEVPRAENCNLELLQPTFKVPLNNNSLPKGNFRYSPGSYQAPMQDDNSSLLN